MQKFGFIFFTTFFGCNLFQFIFGDGNTSKYFFIYTLALSCLTTILSFLIEISKTLSHIQQQNEPTPNTQNLAPFNDAVAEELMRIRSDLVSIKVKQDKLEWGMSHDFLRMYWMYKVYSHSFLCKAYKISDDRWGKIIIALDETNLDEFWPVRFDAEALRKINSQKTYRIRANTTLSVYICEPELDYFENERRAKILSIEKNNSYSDYNSLSITIEINLDTILDDLYCRPKEDIGKNKIIRTIDINHYHHAYNYFIPENKKLLTENELLDPLN